MTDLSITHTAAGGTVIEGDPRPHLTKGDQVRYWGGWRDVVRVNKKSVTVQTQYSWTETVPYDKVRGQRPAEATADA